MIPELVAPLPSHPTRVGGQATRGGGQVNRGRCHIVRGHPRVGGQSGEVQSHFYAFPARPEVESSDAIITCIFLFSIEMHQFYLI